MPTFAELLQQGAGHAWLFIPSAILLGALHGLEPGHSKTMMAAFIVAIHGTVKQAIMLGVAATVSHTAIVWGIAFAGMYFWKGMDADATEPYFQLLSAVIIVLIALWMLWRIYRDQHAYDHHAHHHDGHHSHSHDGHHSHSHDGHHSHPHDGHHSHPHGLTAPQDAYQDAHERAHANDIRRRFSGRPVTDWQIVLFGLTGGLIPCPAAITVLLICLQLKEMSLGFVLVLCFSIGLALTLVSVGTVAALSVHHAKTRWRWFDSLARRAPYLSSMLILLVGIYVGFQGWHGLSNLPQV